VRVILGQRKKRVNLSFESCVRRNPGSPHAAARSDFQ
jgi:hypothetical protein